MAKKKEKLEEKIAYREHIVTDMGNGGSSCSHCKYNLGPDPNVKYETCPGCGYHLREGGTYVPSGGAELY